MCVCVFLRGMLHKIFFSWGPALGTACSWHPHTKTFPYSWNKWKTESKEKLKPTFFLLLLLLFNYWSNLEKKSEALQGNWYFWTCIGLHWVGLGRHLEDPTSMNSSILAYSSNINTKRHAWRQGWEHRIILWKIFNAFATSHPCSAGFWSTHTQSLSLQGWFGI